MTSAIDYINTNFNQVLTDLCELVRIPNVSFPGFDPKLLDKSAALVAENLKKYGLENIQTLTIPDTFPYVYGEYCHAPGKPTLLLYAHHDVQPPGREEIWQSSPFEPVKRDGPGGERLYGRGTADDKAGIFVHLAAIGAYLKSGLPLPVNVKVIIEGEEEIGSPHLTQFLDQYKDLVKADVMVLTDTANYDCGVPSLTVSLRGMVGMDLEVRSLDKTVHSGFWSGLLPDPAMALTKMLAPLVDDMGRVTLAEILALVPELSSKEKEQLNLIPFDENEFRKQGGLVKTAKLLKHQQTALAQLWRYPALTINGIQSSSRAQPGNVINDTAWAKVSIRLAPGMDPVKVEAALISYLKKSVPWGLELSIHKESCAEGWHVDPYGKHEKTFSKAAKALKMGYGKDCIFIGCGATIPFVKPFAAALKDAPTLLIGIEDPYTNAHGENESLLISDFKKAILSEIYLFAELGL